MNLSVPALRRFLIVVTLLSGLIENSLLAFSLVRPNGWPDLLSSLTFSSEPSPLLPCRSEAPEHPTPVRGPADPVDLGITHDAGMMRVDQNDLIVLLPAILTYPVR